MPPTVAAIIVNWNTRDLLAECIESLRRHTADLNLHIIVVDNASTDGSVEMLRRNYPDVQVIVNTKNVGFARANNQAMQQSAADYFLLWNSDAFATPGAVQSLLQLAQSQPRAGLIGAQLRNPDGTFQASYTPFPGLWQEFLILSGLGRLLFGNAYPSRGPETEKGPQVVDYVEGACMLVRREAFEQTGGMDEGYFMYAEEVDWCFALKRAGWQVWYQPQAQVTHLGGASSTGRRTHREADLYRSRVRFFSKHYGPRKARQLKTLIFVLTAVKNLVHGLLRFFSRGRVGRPVVSLKHLASELNKSL
ncbi:MAG: glycosyltransferase family 2 protein [Chloroflexi bacterium]|nr:MAG: glycosyltransferase family 2 protein [Chloroflexota bacterium]